MLPGVVGGISFYGNCLGLPNIGGELAFDPCYAGNPLVNALCLGVMRHADLKLAAATGPGNKVVLFGARTGPDGIGGASVLASASFAGAGAEQAKRPSVQVGDPFMEKLLVECCLELYAAGLVVGIQDLGAAGVACATTELAAGGGADVGMRVRLDAVPLRDSSLGPAEILMSESQERMMAIVEPRRARALPGHLREVGRPGDGDRRGHRHRPAGDDLARRGRRRHPAAQRGRPGPGLPAPVGAPARPRGAGGRRAVPAGPPRHRRGTAVGAAVPAVVAGRGRQELGDRAVRPLRARRDGARDAGGRRPGPGRRADLSRGRARRGRQRAVLPAGPVRGRAARAGRGLPQRGRDRGAAAGRHQLPQLRRAHRSRRDVAVHRGGARSRRRAAWPWACR